MTHRQRRVLKIKLLLEAQQADTPEGPGVRIKPVLASEISGAGEGELDVAFEAMNRLAEELEGQDDGVDEVPRLREDDL